MAGNNIALEGEGPNDDEAQLLNTERRVLEYLRAAMLESGDDPRAMAVAIKNVEAARTMLQRRGPLRVTRSSIELTRAKVSRSV